MEAYQLVLEGIGDLDDLTARSVRLVADIGKYTTRLEQYQLADFGTLKVASVERRKNALAMPIKKYLLVQQRISDVSVEAEEDVEDLDDVFEEHQALLDSYQTLISQLELHADGLTLLENVSILCDTAELSDRTACKEYQRLEGACDTFRDAVGRMHRHEALSAVVRKIQGRMKELTGRMEVESACAEASLIHRQAESLSHTKDLSTSINRQRYEKLVTPHDELHVRVNALPKNEHLLTMVNKMDRIMTELSVRVDHDVSLADEAKDRIPALGEKKSEASSSMKNKFKLDLPKFDGSSLSWHEFWEMFSALIETSGRGDTEKIQLLKQSMETEDSRAVVSFASNGGYSEVVEALKKRYGKPREVYAEHVRMLIDPPAIEDDVEQLIKRSQLINFNVQGIKRCCDGDFSATQFLTAIHQRSMGDRLASKWADYTDELEKPPVHKDLLEFFEKRITALSSNPKAKKIIQKPSGSTGHQPAKLKEKWKSSAYHLRGSREETKDMCPACEEDHPVYFCPKFKAMDVGKRFDFVKDKKMCTNCLSSHHTATTCSSKYTCRECQKKHNSLLHRRTEEPPATSGSSSAYGVSYQASQMQDLEEGKLTFSPTVVAIAKTATGQRSVRAMLDTGATMALVTSRFADLIKAKRCKYTDVLKTCGGDVEVRHAVSIKLGSRVFPQYKDITFMALVVDELSTVVPSVCLGEVEKTPFLSGLPLADPTFGNSDRIDILLGMDEVRYCMRPGQMFSEDPPMMALKTIFGWAVGGSTSGTQQHRCYHVASSSKKTNDELLQAFWEVDKVDGEPEQYTTDQQAAVSHFKDTVSRDPDGRYRVQLPRKEPTPTLGESLGRATKRYQQTKKALVKKDKWTEFVEAVQEYPSMGHAEVVPVQDLDQDCSKSFYLPMHGVVKEESTTTKLRIVFDGSAQSSTGVSLNDTLLKGPSLYPRLTSVINRFRSHAVGMAADISKMFREVGLHDREKDLHRFLVEGSNGEQVVHRMTRLTFGVTPSPFLATQVLLQMASDQQDDHPAAAEVIKKDFYVDDLLSGAPTDMEAKILREEVSSLLSTGGMLIRKWISNSSTFMKTVPDELKAKDLSSLSISPVDCTTTLGVHWNTTTDTLHIKTPDLDNNDKPTKRQVVSAVARTFDIQGWFSPATVIIKILIQQLWKLKVDWDQTIPEELLTTWTDWKRQLPSLTTFGMTRYVSDSSSPVINKQLHGFCDASTAAYGGVIYLRLLHQDTSTSIRLLTSRTRVAPLSPTTIPRLELCGAHLLAKLLKTTAKDMEIPIDNVYAWCDSSVVIGWLNKPPHSLLVFVANRVVEISNLIPTKQWRYVATAQNPADLASRGVMPQELLEKKIWWSGPEWISQSPSVWPKRPDINLDRELPDVKPVVNLVQVEKDILWTQFSGLDVLIRSMAWWFRFLANIRRRLKRPGTDPETANRHKYLSSDEIEGARLWLLGRSQKQSYSESIERLKTGKGLLASDPLLALNPFIGKDGLLRVGGRLENADLPSYTIHPIILGRKSGLTKLIVTQVHNVHHHIGPSDMMGILSATFYISGVKRMVRSISRTCSTCRKVYAQASKQLMGQLPASRVNPAPVFFITGLDFAGPFTCKHGNQRKPSFSKAYACLFICFSSRAVHIELVSELTTEAFLASFQRFANRRGAPSEVYSDNGSNFKGAWKTIENLQDLLEEDETREKVLHYASKTGIRWHFSPSRGPHFGGLWESSVKIVLRKTVGEHKLTFEHLTTVLTEAEATMNSRPIVRVDSMPTDGSPVLTPGHQIIGRPL